MIADVHYKDVLILRLNELPKEPIIVKARSKYLKLKYLFVFNGRKSKFCSISPTGEIVLKSTNERTLHKVFLIHKSMEVFEFYCQTPPLIYFDNFNLQQSWAIKNIEVKQAIKEWLRSHQ